MIYFDRIHFSDKIDVYKTGVSKECDFCHYSNFLHHSFMFQPNICRRCHDLLMMSMKPSSIAILNIIVSDYRCIISLISKNEATNIMQNADLTEKYGRL